jgi:rod shape-determining protein MreD
MKLRLIPAFFLALFIALFQTAFFPNLRLIAFAPFLALLFMRVSLLRALWLGLACGVIMDLLSSQMRFGLYSVNYCLTTLLLYHQRRHFFDDKPLALSLFTVLVAAVSTFIELILRHLPLSGKVIFTNVIAMSFLDGAYAFAWFTCPTKLYYLIKQIKWHKLIFKDKEENDTT